MGMKWRWCRKANDVQMCALKDARGMGKDDNIKITFLLPGPSTLSERRLKYQK
jgi:hypothetical protein